MFKTFFLAVTVFFISTSELSAQNGNNKNGNPIKDNLNAESIIEKYKPALISIWFTDNNYYSYNTYTYIDTTILNGSGFIFGEDGLIGTNYHVVQNIDSLIVKTSDGSFYNAELILTDEKNDFAILKLKDTEDRKFPVVTFGNSDELKAGQEVFAIGSPLGYEYTISSGIIAAIRENERVNLSDPVTFESREKKFDKVIQITAAISPGNSGGALFNSKGEVIGITTYTYTGYGNLNFAIASNTFRNFIDLAESKDFEKSEELKLKIEDNVFSAKLISALNLKSQLSYNWYYSREADTIKNPDSYITEQDSINKINFAKAETNFRDCIIMKPDSFLVYQGLLDLYVVTDNFKKADDLYREIKQKFNSDSLLSLIYVNLSQDNSSLKDYNSALRFYQRLLQQDESQSYLYYKIAQLYEENGNYRKAMEEYRNLLKIDSSFNDAYFRIGKIYFLNLNNPAKAKKYLNIAYEKELQLTGNSPYNSDLHYYLGMIAVSEGRKLDAILSYMELKNIYNYTPEENKKKSELYKAIKKMEE